MPVDSASEPLTGFPIRTVLSNAIIAHQVDSLLPRPGQQKERLTSLELPERLFVSCVSLSLLFVQKKKNLEIMNQPLGTTSIHLSICSPALCCLLWTQYPVDFGGQERGSTWKSIWNCCGLVDSPLVATFAACQVQPSSSSLPPPPGSGQVALNHCWALSWI